MDVTKFTELDQSLESSEAELYHQIAAKCADEFLGEIDDSIKQITNAADSINDFTDKFSQCDSDITKAMESASGILTSILETSDSIENIKKIFSGSKDIILQESDSVNKAVNALEQTISENKTNITSFSDALRSASDSCSVSVKSSLESVDKVRSALEDVKTAVEACSDNWRSSAADQNERVSKFSDQLDELYKQLANTVNENLKHMQSETERYYELMKKINDQLLEEDRNMSDGITEIKTSVSTLSSIVKRFTVIGVVSACVVLALEIVSFFV